MLAFVHDTGFGDLPAEVVAFAQRCVLDLVGVAAAGRTTTLSSIIGNHAARHFRSGESGGCGESGGSGESGAAHLLFDGRGVSPVGAAMANGMTIDAIDAHDGHNLTKGHTGCHQFPALLALSESEDQLDPKEFLAALVVGYEVATRAGIALHATAADYHTSGAWGAVGTAALGARVLGLDHQQTFEAMGIAEYHGPRSQMMRAIDFPTMVKDGSGWGAMAGVSAAYLAADGFTGAPAILLNDSAVDHLWADLGEHWIIFDQYFKPHPVCRWAQPAVEAALSLRRTHDLTAADVERVEISTFHEAARLATWCPQTTEEAQYSMPFPVAAAVVAGRLGAAEVTGAALHDAEVLRLAEGTRIIEDAAHDQAFPARRFARVRLVLRDGRTVTSEDTEPRGDANGPLMLEMDEIRSKFHSLADPVLGAERSTAIEDAIDGLTGADSITPLLELLHAPV